MNYTTTPTALTQLQYDNAVFAINPHNADTYLFYGKIGTETKIEEAIRVGKNQNLLENASANYPSYKKIFSGLIYPDGIPKNLFLTTFLTEDCDLCLDLVLLSEGKIEWK